MMEPRCRALEAAICESEDAVPDMSLGRVHNTFAVYAGGVEHEGWTMNGFGT